MLKSIIKKGVKQFEKKYNYDSTYMIDILESSTKLLLNFNKFITLSRFKNKIPIDVFFVAKIATLRMADCGPCMQLNVDFALEQGMSPMLLDTALNNPKALEAKLKLAYNFAYAVASQSEEASNLSLEFEKVFGKNALVEASMAVATALVYPTLKRGLRHSQSCQIVKVSAFKHNLGKRRVARG